MARGPKKKEKIIDQEKVDKAKELLSKEMERLQKIEERKLTLEKEKAEKLTKMEKELDPNFND